MSADVTPILSGAQPPTSPPKKPRPTRKPPGLVLAASGEYDDFTTRDVLYGLHGVCQVLDLHGDDTGVENSELAAAAHVLASILRSRVEL